jgi:hypothetical protein
MDDLVQHIGELAKVSQRLVQQAVQQYSVEVEAILKGQVHDSQRIERCLDGMLDFCFDPDMLFLYKRLCRYYFDIDPAAAASYVNIYREMWDEKELAAEIRRTQALLKDRKRIALTTPKVVLSKKSLKAK